MRRSKAHPSRGVGVFPSLARRVPRPDRPGVIGWEALSGTAIRIDPAYLSKTVSVTPRGHLGGFAFQIHWRKAQSWRLSWFLHLLSLSRSRRATAPNRAGSSYVRATSIAPSRVERISRASCNALPAKARIACLPPLEEDSPQPVLEVVERGPCSSSQLPGSRVSESAASMPKGHIRFPASIVLWNTAANRSSFFLGSADLLDRSPRARAATRCRWREINARHRSPLVGK